MGVLRFARERPLAQADTVADLHRAAEYKAGRPLSTDEVRRMLDAEWDAVIKHWIAVGKWIARLDAYDEVDAVPLRRTPHGIHDALWRAHQSAAQKASWARKKALIRKGA